MINISEEARQDFYNGSRVRQMGIDVDGIDYPAEERNYFVSDGSDNMWRSNFRNTHSGGVEIDYFAFYDSGQEDTKKIEFIPLQYTWHIMSFECYFQSLASNASRIVIGTTYEEEGRTWTTSIDVNKSVAELRNATKPMPIRVYTGGIRTRNCKYLNFRVKALDSSGNEVDFKMYYRKFSVLPYITNKPIEDQYFPYHPSSYVDGKLQMEPEHLENDNILSEQFSLTESLSSGDDLIFGSCEASVFNIGLVDHRGVLKDRTIRPYVEVLADPSSYTIDKVNWFYDSLHSVKPEDKNRRIGMIMNQGSIGVQDLDTSVLKYDKYTKYKVAGLQLALNKIEQSNHTRKIKYLRFEWWFAKEDGTARTYWYKDYTNLDKYIDLNNPIPFNVMCRIENQENNHRMHSFWISFLDENRQKVDGNITYEFQYTDPVVYFTDTLPQSEKELPKPSAFTWFFGKSEGELEKIMGVVTKLPLGKFKVREAQRSQVHSLIKKDVRAYDALENLNDNAADWYSFYMYGVNTDNYSSAYGFEYARQIYSTYFNLARYLGVEEVDYEREELVEEQKTAKIEAAGVTLKYAITNAEIYNYLHYGKFTVSNPNPEYLYRVNLRLMNDDNEKTILKTHFANTYKLYKDEYGRGLMLHGSILVNETLADGSVNKYLVDANDYFKISDNCIALVIYYPWRTANKVDYGAIGLAVVKEASLFRLYKPFKLTNASTRLVYYKYLRPDSRTDIFAADSSVSARDAIRSVLEPTGCFFHINRYGEPQFIYCTKAGLYPSETLYPDDDLYPRAGTDGDLLSLSKYISFVADDYTVKDIGRIQILKNSFTNESKPVCQWEYIGDEQKENAYIFTNNIFYCNEAMEYEQGSMPEVSSMLEKLYLEISNLGYTPNTTVTHGMPWMEVGDRIGLLTEDGGIESFIFRRTINGIQKMRDTFESKGSEYTKPIDNYAYKLY